MKISCSILKWGLTAWLMMSLHVIGLTQLEWAPIGATWDYGQYYSNKPNEINWLKFEIEKDTTVIGQACRKINIEITGHLGTIALPSWFTYQEAGQVFFYQPEYFNNFFMAYDFSQDVGDTLELDSPEFPNLISMKVDSITTLVTSDNVEIDMMHYSPIDYSCAAYSTVLKGIGSLQGLFPDFCLPLDIESILNFRCFQNADVYLSVVENCNFYSTPNAISEPLDIRIQLFPNPAQDYVQFSWNSDNDLLAFTIRDVSGTLLKNGTLNNNNAIIDIEEIPLGVYFMNIFDSNKGQKVFRFLKQ